jgi:hypothetical protein
MKQWLLAPESSKVRVAFDWVFSMIMSPPASDLTSMMAASVKTWHSMKVLLGVVLVFANICCAPLLLALAEIL